MVPASDYFSPQWGWRHEADAGGGHRCLPAAAQHGLVVVRIEEGIWHSPGFEARLDCIWDGADSAIDLNLQWQTKLGRPKMFVANARFTPRSSSPPRR
jgi:hypothetical protein